jgi:hypothetical protein
MAAVEGTFDRVRRRMVTARIEFMSQLATFHKDDLSTQAVKSEKSPVYISYLLYIIDSLALEQMRRVQSEDDPLLENVAEQVPLVARTSHLPQSLEAVLAAMAARRKETFEFLAALSAEAWERPFHHSEWGDHKFYQLVSMLPLYDQQYTRQLIEMREQS